jgi:hypothetical protein
VMLYSYYIVENCNIDFDKIKRIKGEWADKEPLIKPPFIAASEKNKTRTSEFIDTNQQREINPNAFSGRGLLALTESPLYNIYSWSSKTYETEGNIRKMINPGYHSAEVWYSVLFQLIAALYVLQINKIAFRDFSLKDNVYIKDISVHEHMTTYWKYTIDGIDYYIPNHGYLTMIDSNYKTIKGSDATLGVDATKKRFKIYSNIYVQSGGTKYKDDQLNDYCFSAFIRSFDPNELSKAFTNIGGSKPPEEVMDLLGKIYTEASTGSNKNIGYYICKYMKRFIHNRVGTITKELETKNVRKDDNTPFHKGDLIVHEFQYDTYKFVIYIGAQNNIATVLTKDGPNQEVTEKKVPIDQLFNYSKYEPVQQVYKLGEANLSEEDLLENYIINSN